MALIAVKDWRVVEALKNVWAPLHEVALVVLKAVVRTLEAFLIRG